MSQAAPVQPSPAAQASLEQTLRDLPRVGTRVKDRGYRQVWRFEHGGKPYYLKFYRRQGERDRWRRIFRGSPAIREFHRLQWLQKAGIPAPRAVAFLMGFKLEGADGDAVIFEAIEPSVPLDEYLNDRELSGVPVAGHRNLADQVVDLVHKLGQAGLGHDDLHLGNFLLHDGQVYLIDAYAVRKGGLRTGDVMQLGASVSRFATTSDLVRGWRKLGGGDRPPETNPVNRRLWRTSLQRVASDNRYFGRVAVDGWQAVFFRHTKHPRRWSPASRLRVSEDDWRKAWPALWRQIESDALPVLKRSPSGDVLSAEVELDGRTVPVILKRPRRRYWYRYLNEIGRGARPRRAWYKAWNLVFRNLPTAWPLAVLERRRLGYVVDSVLVTERVPGPTLWAVKLDAFADAAREMLFRRTGRILRQIERHGFSHFDAKASNWIVRADEKVGPSPVMIDVDGIRRRRWIALGIQRLLRSLVDRKQYNKEDSRNLCLGYAPRTRLEDPQPEPVSADEPAGEGI